MNSFHEIDTPNIPQYINDYQRAGEALTTDYSKLSRLVNKDMVYPNLDLIFPQL